MTLEERVRQATGDPFGKSLSQIEWGVLVIDLWDEIQKLQRTFANAQAVNDTLRVLVTSKETENEKLRADLKMARAVQDLATEDVINSLRNP